MSKLEDGQEKVNGLISFVDWIRYVVDWVKGLFGK